MTDSSTCARFDELLLDFAYGELQGPAEREVSSHVSGCARCQAELARMASTRKAMRFLAPEAAPDSGLESLLAAAARAAKVRSEQKAAPRGFRWLVPALTTGLALTAVVAVTAVLVPTKKQVPMSEPVELAAPVASPASNTSPAPTPPVAALAGGPEADRGQGAERAAAEPATQDAKESQGLDRLAKQDEEKKPETKLESRFEARKDLASSRGARSEPAKPGKAMTSFGSAASAESGYAKAPEPRQSVSLPAEKEANLADVRRKTEAAPLPAYRQTPEEPQLLDKSKAPQPAPMEEVARSDDYVRNAPSPAPAQAPRPAPVAAAPPPAAAPQSQVVATPSVPSRPPNEPTAHREAAKKGKVAFGEDETMETESVRSKKAGPAPQASGGSTATLERDARANEINDPAGAASMYEELVALRPDDPRAPSWLWQAANLLDRAGQQHAALLVYRRIEDEYPRSAYAARSMFARSEVNSRLGRAAEAEGILQQVPQQYPGTPEAEKAAQRLTELQNQRQAPAKAAKKARPAAEPRPADAAEAR